MRRGLPFLLILNFLLGPLAAAVQADDESRLPSCCRRHGQHHCAMSQAEAAVFPASGDSEPAFAAPAHCPFFPRTIAPMPQAPAAEIASTAIPAEMPQQPCTPTLGRLAAFPAVISTHAGRAPPAVQLPATNL